MAHMFTSAIMPDQLHSGLPTVQCTVVMPDQLHSGFVQSEGRKHRSMKYASTGA